MKKLGRYEILSRIGEGGMGIVYKALDPMLGRNVALKVGKLSAMGYDADKTGAEECLKEARLAAQFIHPNIAITYDGGFENDLFYMALEYIDGGGLNENARPHNLLPHKQVLEIIFNICFALEYIHEKGYIHLDIKPSNIMLTKRNEVKLMDFGIARLSKDQKKQDEESSGSIFNMAPEQFESEAELGPHTDIYALGTVLYELITGKRPFDGENQYSVMYKILNTPFEPVHKIKPDIAPDLDRIISKALSKDPRDRYQSTKDLANELKPIIKGVDSKVLDKKEKVKIEGLRRILFFQHFQYSELAEVVELSTWSFHKKGKWITKTGDDESNIFIIVRGRVGLYLKEEKIKVLHEGDCFGEVAVLYSMPRTANLKAIVDSWIMSINANILNQSSPDLQVKFLKEFLKNKTHQLFDVNLKLMRL